MYPLRVYLRYLRNEIPTYTNPKQTFQNTPQIKNMCQQWIEALKYLNGRLMRRVLEIPENIKEPIYTDASNLGYGFHYSTHWTFGAFHPDEVETNNKNNIREREMFPVLIAGETFGPQWSGHRVHLYIDNENAMSAIINKDIRNEKAHELLIRICQVMMKYKFEIFVDRIKTEDNTLADRLSRLQITEFKQICQNHKKPIDPAPMLHVRPPLDTNNPIMFNKQKNVYEHVPTQTK